MPLVKRPYLQEETFQSFKPGGTGGESFSSSYGGKGSGEQGPRAPVGFVNTDRLLQANRDVLDQTKQQIQSVGSDIDKTSSDYSNKLKSFGPVGLSGNPENVSGLDVGSILEHAKSSPDVLRNYYNAKVETGPQASYDENLFNPVYKKITDLSINSSSNPYNYGLLKTSKAIEDNTFQNYLDKVAGERSKLQLQTNTVNDERQRQAEKLQGEQTGFRKNLSEILYGILPQLQNNRPFGPISYGGKDLTDIAHPSDLGESYERDRSGLLVGLKNIASIIGADPNTIGALPLDKDWLKAILEGQKRKELEKSSIEAQKEEGLIPGRPELNRRKERQEDARRQNTNYGLFY